MESALTAWRGRKQDLVGKYLRVYAPGHPIVTGSQARVHRLELFDKVGGGAQQCYWCGWTVEWEHIQDVLLCAIPDEPSGVPSGVPSGEPSPNSVPRGPEGASGWTEPGRP